MNAKNELLEHVGRRVVKYVRIRHLLSYDTEILIEGSLDEVIPRLNFQYNNGYGLQELEGTIWYTDGTWSNRSEYDGSEWWNYFKCPPLPGTK